ncbi:hypothetical protein EB001_01220 [bacterium]|nr:hypothetical protein [bacterium]
MKTNQTLISEIEEREDEDADCVLINPKEIIRNYLYKEDDPVVPNSLKFGEEYIGGESSRVYLTLDNYIEYTYQKQIPIRSADIMTIVEPREDLLKFYRDVVG